ncbi:hypothetical protein E2C01_057113 [Portunus trituberculatus]|uniref:Uncharacterized protein n=1 Tax=Portunus trituberculatus TaxID=210409 RepID=A0A5B7GVY8_PORTR|nr:hypothetical protein [Portunus trituberculatus]
MLRSRALKVTCVSSASPVTRVMVRRARPGPCRPSEPPHFPPLHADGLSAQPTSPMRLLLVLNDS